MWEDEFDSPTIQERILKLDANTKKGYRSLVADAEITELRGDPDRQAPDLFKGTRYQLWHSVLAWVNLRDGEILFLEGAEDFDVASASGGTSAQVKATTANFTLGSSYARDALINYWEIVQKNPGKDIQYRFITTSHIGHEQNAPFGTGVSGTSVWNDCVAGSPAIRKILGFLRSTIPPTTTLATFLKSASESDAFDRLIAKCRWDCAAPESPELESAVRDKLIVYGKTQKQSAQASASVAAELFLEVSKVASEKGSPRKLELSDFHRIFDEKTRIDIPRELYHDLVNRAVKASGSTGLAEVSISPGASAIERTPPPRPGGLADRELMNELSDRLRTLRVVVLHGSSGSGKSILAGTFAQASPHCAWVSLSAKDLDQTLEILGTIRHFVHMENYGSLIVLDDFDFAPAPEYGTRSILTRLVSEIRAHGGQLLLTSQRAMPKHACTNLGLSEAVNLTVGCFTKTEIADFIRICGCPPDLEEDWSASLYLQTEGHPQLTHARVVTLTKAQWPKPTTADLLAPSEEILEAKAQARALLKETSHLQSELVYRLSVIPGAFTRETALEVGQIEPAVADPGDLFDGLIGPWIEQISRARFHLSPLLENSFQHVWAAEQISKIRAEVGLSIAKAGQIGPSEANQILFLGWMSKNSELLAGIARNLFFVPAELRSLVYRRVNWFTKICVTKGELLFPSDVGLNYFLRMVQLQIASENESETAAEIAEVLSDEISDAQSGDSLPRLLGIVQILSAPNVPLSPARLVEMLSTLVVLWNSDWQEDADEDRRDAYIEMREHFASMGGVRAILVIGLGQRILEDSYFFSFLEALDQAPPALVAEFSALWNEAPDHARMFVDQSWVIEGKRPHPNWERLDGNLDSALRFAAKHQLVAMEDSIFKLKILIYDELWLRPEAAESLIKTTLSGRKSVLLRDSIATFRFHQRDYAGALAIWRDITADPAKWADEGANAYFPLALRGAALCQNHCGDVAAAEILFRRASTHVTSPDFPLLSASLLGEAAICCWMQKRHTEAIQLAYKVYKSLKPRSTSWDEDKEAYKLGRCLGQFLLHIVTETGGYKHGPDTYLPPLGLLSNTDIPDKMRELGPIEWWRLLTQLALIEQSLGVDIGIISENYSTLQGIPAARTLLLSVNPGGEKALSVERRSEFPRIALENARYMRVVRAMNDRGEDLIAPASGPPLEVGDDDLETFVLASEILVELCVNLILQGNVPPGIRDTITQSARTLGAAEHFATSIDALKWLEAEPQQISEFWNANSTVNADWNICVAIMAVTTSYGHSTVCVAQALFLWHHSTRFHRLALGRESALAFSRTWKTLSTSKFAFSMPMVTVPPLLATCDEPFNNWSKTARIVKSAAAALNVRFPSQVSDSIDRVLHRSMSRV